MVSENGIRDLNTLPKSESTSKDTIAKPYIKNSNENLENKQTTSIDPFVEGNEVVNGGVAEVEYIESEKLNDFEDVDKSLKMLLTCLDTKDWVLLCETLNNVHRFSVYHKEALKDILERVITLIVNSLKNPRSAVCKTGIMTSSDIFKAFGDHIIEFLDPLLVQLLLKSSQDKRFVCEAAEKALIALTSFVSAFLLLPKLQPYLKNLNPRVRAKASMCFSRSLPRLGVEEMKEYGMEKLIEIGASLLSDQLPESREAARALILELQIAYKKYYVLATCEKPHGQGHSWEQFCELNLSKLSAQAVLRVTSVGRE